jgi:AhpD family alkylhydroperoxidase
LLERRKQRRVISHQRCSIYWYS